MTKKLPPLTAEMREYFRRLGSQGGKKKAENMTAKDRKALGTRLARARREAARKRKDGTK